MKTVTLVLTLTVPEDVSVQAAIESVECTYKGQDLLHDCRISGYEQEATQ
jgi:hypothetical protein